MKIIKGILIGLYKVSKEVMKLLLGLVVIYVFLDDILFIMIEAGNELAVNMILIAMIIYGIGYVIERYGKLYIKKEEELE